MDMRRLVPWMLVVACGSNTNDADLRERVTRLEIRARGYERTSNSQPRWWHCIARDPWKASASKDELTVFTGCLRSIDECLDLTKIGGTCIQAATAWCVDGDDDGTACMFSRESCKAIVSSSGTPHRECVRTVP